MPAILLPELEARWLDPDMISSREVLALLRPHPEESMVSIPVPTAVNGATSEGAGLMRPSVHLIASLARPNCISSV